MASCWRTGFTHSLLYRSVMAFGRTVLVAAEDAKRRAMANFLDRLYPGRPPQLRPLRQAELDQLSVLAVEVSEERTSHRAPRGN